MFFCSREAFCSSFDDNAMNPVNMSHSRGLAFSKWQRGVGSISPNVHKWLVSRTVCNRFRDARSNTSGDSCFVNFVICFGEMSMFSWRSTLSSELVLMYHVVTDLQILILLRATIVFNSISAELGCGRSSTSLSFERIF